MSKIYQLVAVAALSILLVQGVRAQDSGHASNAKLEKLAGVKDGYRADDTFGKRKARAVELVTNTIELYKKKGKEVFTMINKKEGMFDDQNNPFRTGISVATLERDVMASYKYPGLVGTNDISWKSPDGTHPMRLLADEAKAHPEGGQVTYMSNRNPHTGIPGTVTIFYLVYDGLIFSSPAYHLDSPYRELVPAENGDLYTHIHKK